MAKKKDLLVGKCDGCGKNKRLVPVNGLKLCTMCEDELFEGMIKSQEKQQPGEDYVRNEGFKKPH